MKFSAYSHLKLGHRARYQLIIALALSSLCYYSSADEATTSPTVTDDNATVAVEEADDDKWYEKSFEEILSSKIVTATRNQSTKKDAPGVVTVFTSEDIARMGLRSVKEVLERTTGFFVNRQLTGAVVGSRGIIADNDQFLMLIDGHNMNSIYDKGMGAEFIIPGLEQVDRIEIIRGPGSTLWGSDASLGIIHIITKDGADINGLRVTANRSYDDNSRHINIQAGEAITDDIDVMASLTLMESDGFAMEGVDFGRTEPWTDHWDEIEDSLQFYSKVKLRDFHIKARASQTNISRSYNIYLPPDTDKAFRQRNHFYLDVAYIKEIKPNIIIETRFFGDLMDRTQLLVTPEYSGNIQRAQESESSEERRFGFEFITRWNDLANHNVLLGYRKVKTDLSPFTSIKQYEITTTATSAPNVLEQLVVPSDIDESTSIFIEDEWRVIPDTLKVLMGLRLDTNTLREDNDILLPRFDINWTPTNNWQIKYSYNTGYIRPPVAIGFLGQTQTTILNSPDLVYNKGASESQETSSHDIQVNFTAGRVQTNLNLYHNTIDNPFQLLFEEHVIDGKVFNNYYANTEAVTSYGLELGWMLLLTNQWQVYGDISKVLSAEIASMTGSSGDLDYDLNDTTKNFAAGSYTPDGTMSGFPHLMINVGVNWDIDKNILSNLHLRLWDEMYGRHYSDLTKTVEYGPEVFVDYNILFTEILGSSFDASFYVKNLLDNDDSEIYMLGFNNTWSDRGRTVGGSVSYLF